MTTVLLNYDQFIEMFEPSQDFSGYPHEEDNLIEIEWKTVPCKNPAREAGGWCAILWKPASEVYDDDGKWIRQEYNGSSPFAMWWCQQLDDDEDPYESYTRPCMECGEDFTPSVDHADDGVCDECVSEKGKKQVLAFAARNLRIPADP